MGAMSGEWVVVASRVRQELGIEVVAEVVSELCGSFAAFFEVSTDCENQAEDTEETAEEEHVICKVDHCVLLCFLGPQRL
jgi:phosphopantetheinyl transferase